MMPNANATSILARGKGSKALQDRFRKQLVKQSYRNYRCTSICLLLQLLENCGYFCGGGD
jgi:hypothetical protein